MELKGQEGTWRQRAFWVVAIASLLLVEYKVTPGILIHLKEYVLIKDAYNELHKQPWDHTLKGVTSCILFNMTSAGIATHSEWHFERDCSGGMPVIGIGSAAKTQWEFAHFQRFTSYLLFCRSLSVYVCVSIQVHSIYKFTLLINALFFYCISNGWESGGRYNVAMDTPLLLWRGRIDTF